MPKVWNFGNTTLRNPNRLQDGLILLEKEFQGNLYGQERESLFVQRLNENRYYVVVLPILLISLVYAIQFVFSEFRSRINRK